jgi:hypothetical protein
MAMVRGLVLLAAALVLGVVLLQKTDTTKTVAVSARTTTTAKHVTTTTNPAATTTTVATRAPQTIKVIVANGTDVQGAAGRVNQELLAAKYNALSPTDASQKVKASAVYFTPGYDREAAVLAQLLQLPPTDVQALPTPLPVKDPHDANIVVVVGPDLAGRVATTATTAASTTTTVKKATTTTTTAKPATTTTTAKP